MAIKSRTNRSNPVPSMADKFIKAGYLPPSAHERLVATMTELSLSPSNIRKPFPSPENWGEDGLDHINICRRDLAVTKLGGKLNPATTPGLNHPLYGHFASLNNLMLWLSHPDHQDDRLRTMNPRDAMAFLREVRPQFPAYYDAAVGDSLNTIVKDSAELCGLLRRSSLPFDMYYVDPKSGMRIRSREAPWYLWVVGCIRSAVINGIEPDFTVLLPPGVTSIYPKEDIERAERARQRQEEAVRAAKELKQQRSGQRPPKKHYDDAAAPQPVALEQPTEQEAGDMAPAVETTAQEAQPTLAGELSLSTTADQPDQGTVENEAAAQQLVSAQVLEVDIVIPADVELVASLASGVLLVDEPQVEVISAQESFSPAPQETSNERITALDAQSGLTVQAGV